MVSRPLPSQQNGPGPPLTRRATPAGGTFSRVCPQRSGVESAGRGRITCPPARHLSEGQHSGCPGLGPLGHPCCREGFSRRSPPSPPYAHLACAHVDMNMHVHVHTQARASTHRYMYTNMLAHAHTQASKKLPCAEGNSPCGHQSPPCPWAGLPTNPGPPRLPPRWAWRRCPTGSIPSPSSLPVPARAGVGIGIDSDDYHLWGRLPGGLRCVVPWCTTAKSEKWRGVLNHDSSLGVSVSGGSLGSPVPPGAVRTPERALQKGCGAGSPGVLSPRAPLSSCSPYGFPAVEAPLWTWCR